MYIFKTIIRNNDFKPTPTFAISYGFADSLGLQLSGKLNSYLADIDKQAEDMGSRPVKQMAEREGITEQFKAENQMEWVRRMNNIRNRANETVLHELIYDV